VAALLGDSNSDESAFFCVTRSVEMLRSIGAAPDIDTARRGALAAAVGADVVVITMHDELVRLGERSVQLGIELLADIGVPVLLLMGFGNETTDEYLLAAAWVRKHVRAVLSIDASEHELTAAVRAVSAGLVVVEPRVSEAMLAGGARKRPRADQQSVARAPGSALPLSAREREVLALLAGGLATKNIAHELEISAHTVKAHVESIFAKFGATTRAEAVAIGVRRGAVML
jgi:DNA-binding NarL/FixJ family response regulator